ncbi:hypothetical protein EDB89DRAFT_2199433, partial [Lactarius sanguifluus]
FVIVSLLGKQFQTPVCKLNLNPIYAQKDATFDFPIYTSLVHKLDKLEFVVCDDSDSDLVQNNYLGRKSLPIDEWFRGTVFAFNDNKPLPIVLDSSPPTSTMPGTGTITPIPQPLSVDPVHGPTMLIKLGFFHPPNSTGLVPDFGRIYNALVNTVLAPEDPDHVGVVVLEICGAKDLPKWRNITRLGWDMDPFVQVSIGSEVARTRVVHHSLNPVWDEQLVLQLRREDLSDLIRLTVFDRAKFMQNSYIGETEINIASLVERAINTRLPSITMPTILELSLPLNPVKRPERVYKPTPIITFRASYRPYDALRKQGGQRPRHRPHASDLTRRADINPQVSQARVLPVGVEEPHVVLHITSQDV